MIRGFPQIVIFKVPNVSWTRPCEVRNNMYWNLQVISSFLWYKVIKIVLILIQFAVGFLNALVTEWLLETESLKYVQYMAQVSE